MLENMVTVEEDNDEDVEWEDAVPGLQREGEPADKAVRPTIQPFRNTFGMIAS